MEILSSRGGKKKIVLGALLTCSLLSLVFFLDARGLVRSLINNTTPETKKEEVRRKALALSANDILYGPQDARIQVIVYSDVRCRYCRSLLPKLEQLVGIFSPNVVMAYRSAPLVGRASALADEEKIAACIQEQSAEGYLAYKFIRSLMLDMPPESVLGDIDPDVLYRHSDKYLNRQLLVSCIEGVHSVEAVARSHESALTLGVRPIPHTFIVMDDQVIEIVGNKPFAVYEKIIFDLLDSTHGLQ